MLVGGGGGAGGGAQLLRYPRLNAWGLFGSEIQILGQVRVTQVLVEALGSRTMATAIP